MTVAYKITTTFLFFLLGISGVFAQKFSVTPQMGYFIQSFNWSIAGNENGTSPNVLSELKWNKLRGLSNGLSLAYQPNDQLGFNIRANISLISKGQGNDSDYANNNRTESFSNIDFSSNEGYSSFVSATSEYQFFQNHHWRLKALLGYQMMSDKFFGAHLYEGSEQNAIVYHTYWHGGNTGVQFGYRYGAYAISAQYLLGVYDYKAKANWPLNERFQHPISFKQLALGLKHSTEMTVAYHLSPRMAIQGSALYDYIFTKPGLDIAYKADNTTQRTQYNGNGLNRWTFLLGLKYSFGINQTK